MTTRVGSRATALFTGMSLDLRSLACPVHLLSRYLLSRSSSIRPFDCRCSRGKKLLTLKKAANCNLDRIERSCPRAEQSFADPPSAARLSRGVGGRPRCASEGRSAHKNDRHVWRSASDSYGGLCLECNRSGKREQARDNQKLRIRPLSAECDWEI